MNNEKKAPVRQIKFRGLRVDGKGLVYGSLIQLWSIQQEREVFFIQDISGVHTHEVIPETVGQFTGMFDNNSTEVYEGDNIKYNGCIGEAIFGVGSFFIYFEDNDYEVEFSYISNAEFEVIGNIHENKNEG